MVCLTPKTDQRPKISVYSLANASKFKFSEKSSNAKCIAAGPKTKELKDRSFGKTPINFFGDQDLRESKLESQSQLDPVSPRFTPSKAVAS